MTSVLEERNVQELLTDKKVVDQVIESLLGDRAVVCELEEDVADDIHHLFQGDPEFRRGLVEAANSNARFKQQIITTLAGEMKA